MKKERKGKNDKVKTMVTFGNFRRTIEVILMVLRRCPMGRARLAQPNF